MSERPAVVVRPRRARVVAWVAAAAIVVVATLVATGLRGGTVFQPGDQYAMIGLGFAGAVATLAFARPKVTADEHSIRIRNVVGGYDLPWDIVRAVRFDQGAAWASLELEDDDLVSVMAIQRADKQHAVASINALRALLAEHHARA